MFERAYAPEAPRPSWGEIEALRREGHARALEMERERLEIERRTSALLGAAANGDHLGALRQLSARHAEVDRNVRWLRSLLVELREYGAGRRPPGQS